MWSCIEPEEITTTRGGSIYLDEANLLGVAAEALPAAHKPILADDGVGVPAHTAVNGVTHNTSKIVSEIFRIGLPHNASLTITKRIR